MNADYGRERLTKLDFGLSGAIALIVAAASIAGLLAPSLVYPTVEARRAFMSNDVVNLTLGLPVLIATLLYAQRGGLKGLLLWPGALLYLIYNYLAYAAAMAFGRRFALYLSVAVMSSWALYRLLKRIDGTAVRQKLEGMIPVRAGAAVLIGLGSLFFLRAAAALIGALSGRLAMPPSERGVLVADILVTPLWVLAGIMLWRRRALGYTVGPAVLFQASMLFAGLLAFFALQPFIAGLPFPAQDFLVILAMGMICFIPFGLFLRGMAKSRAPSSGSKQPVRRP